MVTQFKRLPFLTYCINCKYNYNMGFIFIFLVFVSPIIQIVLASKRINNKSRLSILGITILMMLSTVILSILAVVLYTITIPVPKNHGQCDMTIPGVIGTDFLLVVLVISLIGIISGSIYRSKNKKQSIQSQSVDNPYDGFLKQSRTENLKRWS
jgi:hypothetical protein